MVDISQFFDAVFFDMDGLMVDSEPEWFKSETEVTAKFGYNWSEEDQIACLGGPLTRVGTYMHDKCEGAETPEYFTQTLIDTQALKMRGNTPTMPGALELVRELQSQGVKTGLVSASPRNIVDAVLDGVGFPQSDIHSHFDFSFFFNLVRYSDLVYLPCSISLRAVIVGDASFPSTR